MNNSAKVTVSERVKKVQNATRLVLKSVFKKAVLVVVNCITGTAGIP